jgi:glycosyltransferase involved in cell wall biosynthesis
MLDPQSVRRSAWKKRLAMWLYMRRSLGEAACLHATSEMEAQHLREFGIAAPIAVIPNGLDTAPYHAVSHPAARAWLAQARPELKDKRILLFLSRIHPQKGTEPLVEAWQAVHDAYPDWRLLMVGPDCLGHRAELEARIQRAGLADSVSFMGAIVGEEKVRLYAACDLFVLPSPSESFGMVVVEALASAMPVIATTGTPWRELRDVGCGWWVEYGSAGLVAALREAMSLSRLERTERGLRGRELVVWKYSWAMVARQMVELYTWLISGGARPDFVKVAGRPSEMKRMRADMNQSAADSSKAGLAVTHVVSSLALRSGGPPQAVVGFCEALGRIGCPVTLCTIDMSASRGPALAVDPKLVEVRAVPGHVGLLSVTTVPPGFKAMLEDAVGRSQVVHVHGLWDLVGSCATTVARKLGKPCVLAPIGMLDPLSLRRSHWKKSLAMLLYQRRSLKDVACFQVSSAQEAQHVRQFGLAQPTAVIPNGIDVAPYLRVDRSAARAWLEQARPEVKGKRILLFLSRIHPQKGTEPLVAAWGALRGDFPDWHLVMAGPDCLGHRAQLEARINRAGLAGSVSLLDAVAGDDKTRLYAASDLFVLPSLSEAFGMVVTEALASAVPVVTTTGTPWGELRELGCGWWVDYGAASLTPALREAMSLPEGERAAKGRRGRELAVAKYSWATVARQTLELYTWLVSGGSPPAFVRKD